VPSLDPLDRSLRSSEDIYFSSLWKAAVGDSSAEAFRSCMRLAVVDSDASGCTCCSLKTRFCSRHTSGDSEGSCSASMDTVFQDQQPAVKKKK
jgi:hypothetical protein